MAGEDAVPDHAELRPTAARRTSRGWWVAVLVVVLAFVLAPLTVLISGRASLSNAQTAVSVVVLVVGAVIAAASAWWIRRRGPAPGLVAGADRNTRRAVRRALRTGRSPDARIDALVREAADRNLRNSWLRWFCAVLLILNLGLLIGRITEGDDLWQVVLSAVTVALWATALVVSWVVRRRSDRYLRRSPVIGAPDVVPPRPRSHPDSSRL